jgi:two-component system invasion response regulator UvrY
MFTLSPGRFTQVRGPTHRSTRMASLRALVCDDYSMVRETIRPLLVEAGFETVREATLATEAISLAEMSQPDVIVLDLSLPGMSGLQAIPILKLVSPRSTVIVFSAYDIWREACVDAGAAAYVDKGDLEALADTLQRVASKTPLGRIVP